MRTLLVASLLLCATAAHAEEGSADAESSTGLRKRFDPGFGIAALGDVRGYEGLSGASSAAGASLSYSWDLVTLSAEYLQGLAVVGERKPAAIKANFDFAFFTLDKFSVLGLAGVDYVMHGPDRQTAASDASLWGPEFGLGMRYRAFAKMDLFAHATAAYWQATSGPRRFYFEPGVEAGIRFHPFASED